MGYDIHITRRKFWADDGDDITAEEWLAYVRTDSELRLQPGNGKCFAEWSGGSWLDWSGGDIYTKNPDDALISKMVAIGKKLGATVQGDDGEIYDGGGGQPSQQPKASLGSRIAGWFSKPQPKPQQQKVEHEPLPFRVGDTVVDTWGFEQTVLSIDANANGGLGEIKSRRNNDGTVHSYAVIAHPFKSPTRK